MRPCSFSRREQKRLLMGMVWYKAELRICLFMQYVLETGWRPIRAFSLTLLLHAGKC